MATTFTRSDYKIAYICSTDLELAPVEAILDDIHPDLPFDLDQNSYTLGRMGAHNVVIAVTPNTGNNSAAHVATQLLNDFPCIRFTLIVGTGSGVPDMEGNGEHDIRLGDVVVSRPSRTDSGVVQFDRGKCLADGQFERTGILRKPPHVLLASVKRLESLHRRTDTRIPTILKEMVRQFPKMKETGYAYQGEENDQLFQASVNHQTGSGGGCDRCDPGGAVMRKPRKSSTPSIHYGLVGSSNKEINDSATRDCLRAELNPLCIEMSAAGLMDDFPCLVICGISDYADSHKSKRWQPYAAATAAAYAKELLSFVPPAKVASPEKLAVKHQKGTTITTGDVRSFVNGSVTGDLVGGDKVSGNKICRN